MNASLTEPTETHEKQLGAAATASMIFKVIRDRGPLYSTEIVRWTGLAKSTVSIYVDKLINIGIIREELQRTGKRKKLKVAESAGFVVGVDLGQTHLYTGLCDLEARLIDWVGKDIDLQKERPESILAYVCSAIRFLCEKHGVAFRSLFGIGMGVPGPVDFQYGMPISPPVMPGWDHYPVKSFLSDQFKCTVMVDNDVNVMALGERDYGVGSEDSNFMFVKVGTGIGCGIIVNGSIYRGAKGAAGDIGHIGIDGNDVICRCGNRGCLEAVAGGRALQQKAEQAARSGLSPFLAERLKLYGTVTVEMISEGADSGDEICLQIIQEAGRYIGDTLAKLVNFFNPSLIVIGGGVANFGERFLAAIRASVYRRSTPLATADLVIRKSSLGDRVGMIGSAILVLDEIFSQSNVSIMLKTKEAFL